MDSQSADHREQFFIEETNAWDGRNVQLWPTIWTRLGARLCGGGPPRWRESTLPCFVLVQVPWSHSGWANAPP
ncbi:hypothetical protein TcWFU_007839 [Taenia crassiceps]|uniref:Uncharacterized protein n=1 Tax=Taenia crassiceps TaxID=6207 RepID=A0ABR4QSK3_9CEST